MQYATLHVGGSDTLTVGERIHFIRETAGEYLATARVWANIFRLEAEAGDDPTERGRVLQEVFELWRRKDGVEATVAWGRWLLMNGRGKEAINVVVRARGSLKETERSALEKRWTATLDEEAEDVVKNVEE
jgi:U3 small nucleolar RNA-associated protein 6